MPAKKKGGAGKKGKKNKGVKAALEKENLRTKLRALHRIYTGKCTGMSVSSGRIMKDCKSALEEEKPVTQFILESGDVGRPVRPSSRSKPKSADKQSSKPPSAASSQPGTSIGRGTASALSTRASLPSVRLRSLMEATLEANYDYLRCLHVWNIPLSDEDVVALALYMESRHGLNLKVLELRDTHLSPWSISRLSGPIVRVGLTSLNLDYNKIPTVTLLELCDRLQHNIFMTSVSFSYCQLEPECGESIGCMAAASQIRNLSLVGNRLQCHGTVDLIRPLVSLCEAEYSSDADKLKDDETNASRMEGVSPDMETQQDEEAAEGVAEDQEEGGLAGLSRMGPLTPSLARLDIRDNAIDYFGICKEERVKTFEPIICMRAVKRLILASPVLEDINLDQNSIGDGGARELLHGLQQRKEDGLPMLKLTVTAIQISPDTFQKITELSSQPKKKKKRGKKKKS